LTVGTPGRERGREKTRVDRKGIESYDRVRRRSGIQRRGVEDLIEISTRLLEEERREGVAMID
jgi:hypothetical protein